MRRGCRKMLAGSSLVRPAPSEPVCHHYLNTEVRAQVEKRPARPRAAQKQGLRAGAVGRAQRLPGPKMHGLTPCNQQDGSEESSALGQGPRAGPHGYTSAPLIWNPPGPFIPPYSSAAWIWG